MKVSEYPEALPTPDLQDCEVVSRYAINPNGRDFVVGDIHGMFSYLQVLLEQISFDQETDRLFSVGDLVDRGPESQDTLAWLGRPWFHACRGNHEQFAIDSTDPEQQGIWVKYNGGSWWLDLGVEEQEQFRASFSRLPLAMEVETGTGTVGIVHADVPPLLTWDRFLDLLESGNPEAIFYAMWSRHRIQGICTTLPVRGRVDRVYCGHTPTRDTVFLNNVHYIDTGAVYSHEGYEQAKLTVVEIHPARHREYTIGTYAPI